MSIAIVETPVTSSKVTEGPLSPEQVASYRENGFMKLEQVIEPEIVQGLLSRAKERMGEDPLTVKRGGAGERINAEYRWYARWDECSVEDEWIRSLSHSPKLAAIASQLCGEPVRFYSDHVFAKAPATKAGGDTPWHQDFPHHPHDRQGALNIWIALVDCPPEKGTMRFLEGSHRAGQLGRYFNRRDNITLIDEHPWVLERYRMSDPILLNAGDATVHDMAVIHAAPENTTNEPRWVYSTLWLPVSVRYTGANNHRTDNIGLVVDQPMEHPRFPVIAT